MSAPFTITEKLEAIFASLPDVLGALKTHTGRPGYGTTVLFRAYLATFVLNSTSLSEALRTIADNPNLTKAVGGAPIKWAISRFLKKLKDTDILDQCMAETAELLKELLPEFGKVVAIDSSDISAYSSFRRTDPDAQSGRKKGTDGKMKWWYEYKSHMISDATYELPISEYVTPANESDMHQVRRSLELLPNPPTHVLADSGYYSAANRAIVEEFNAIQVIKPHPLHKVQFPTTPIYSKRASIQPVGVQR